MKSIGRTMILAAILAVGGLLGGGATKAEAQYWRGARVTTWGYARPYYGGYYRGYTRGFYRGYGRGFYGGRWR